ncbi:MAG: leucine--tRNA ligase [Spirochaetes bacterium]|nr:leucine--tRNA ligase [Spirochaetota bacterium]
MDARNLDYNFEVIEKKWQKIWEEQKIFNVDENDKRPKYYTLEMFPYPSGKIHMGHVRNYTIADCIARFHGLNGFSVLHPIGWDSFGLPAENAAIDNKIPPAKWTHANIATMKGQLKKLGFSYDWTREVATCTKEYYRWGQWLLLKMYEKGLLYRKAGEVNWCPDCATVLANEQVADGKCWRCDSTVEMRTLDQWYIRITDYVEELLSGHEELKEGWPERVLNMQQHWIGKSEGAKIVFKLDDGSDFPIFTTRPDTVFGVRFMAIAWDHPELKKIALKEKHAEIDAFIERAKKINQREDYVKEGVFTGRYIVNPFNGDKVPLYAANFVLAGYGFGQIMAVPAHDERDFQFAKKYNIDIKVVITPEGKTLDPASMKEAYVDDGVLVNSGEFNGLTNREAISKITAYVEAKKMGKKEVQYKFRDWLISRQRYWGNPIPFIYCDTCGVVPVPEKDLPVILPEDVSIDVGGNPLAKMESFVNTTCPKCGGKAKRETDTMDTFICSSWYFSRYTDAHNNAAPFLKARADKWLPVDQYIGGIEHACMHLLYARFFHKFTRDIGLVSCNEPFKRLLTQGMVVSNSYFAPKIKKYYTSEEYEAGLPAKENAGDVEVKIDKMSKSKRNGIDPDEMITHFGADAARVFILFASPPELDLEWSDDGIKGGFRYVGRVWRLFTEHIDAIQNASAVPQVIEANALAARKATHKTIKRVTNDIRERMHFNTAIAALMELLNALTDFKPVTDADKAVMREALSAYAVMLNPIAPHVTEELWSLMGNRDTITKAPWPAFDEALTKDNSFELVLQINGKLRDRVQAPVNISEDEAKKLAMENAKMKEHLKDKTVVKTIYVPRKLVNVVIRG